MIAALLLAALAVLASLPASPAHAAEAGATAAPDGAYTFGAGDFSPAYDAPAPGSYELPPIDTVADYELVDAEGRRTTLGELIGGHLAVVSFIYGTCNERSGCPMSTALLHRLDSKLAGDAALASSVALLTISFDPERDTTERLTLMQKQRAPESTWKFVTARDEASLAPLLADFGQSVSKLRNADGTWTGAYRHVLKVFLLDRKRRVRNIYSAGYLDAELVRNDLLTLRMSEKR